KRGGDESADLLVSLFSHDRAFAHRFLTEHLKQMVRTRNKERQDEIEPLRKQYQTELDEAIRTQTQLEEDLQSDISNATTQSDRKLLTQQLERLTVKRDELRDDYNDFRSVFSPKHPLHINAKKDLEHVEKKIVQLQQALEHVSEQKVQTSSLRHDLAAVEESIATHKKQLLDLQEAEQKSATYLTFERSPSLRPDGYVKTLRREVLFGLLFGALIGWVLSKARTSWLQKK
ncbi:MAG: hypothetical protein VX278_16155, partial [Myxococcota bacterium]|nr:hypothetical protein [Myxococcota bacterium]